ncbi:glycine--tRNA ligase subunit beta [Sphingomonas sp. I4]
MGGYYAAAQGEDSRVAEAVRDHYKPVGQGDDVPTAPVTVAVALADKLDTLVTFFSHDMRPTGSKDPFALRRAALGVILTLTGSGVRLPIRASIFERVIDWKDPEYGDLHDALANEKDADERAAIETEIAARAQRIDSKILDFFADRLKVQQREAGVRHDLIDAVFALGGEDDLVRLLARVRALQAFVTTDDGTNLLAGYKRAANILKKEGVDGDQGWTAPTYNPEPAEADLIAALDAAEPKAADAVKAEDFEAAMAALASLRAPIDRFFDDVTVNDADPAKRTVRLALLARVRAAVHTVADFSRIEG